MSRYIDADTMLEYLELAYDNHSDMDTLYNTGVLVAINYIKHKADTIDIVRCKECRYKRIYDGETKYYYCALEDRPNRQWSVDETDYCSWAEREGE